MGADIIIGSDMSVPRGLDELNSPVDLLMQTIILLSSSTFGPAKKMVDLGVHHELKGYNMLSFDDASVDDIIDQGYRNALEQREVFETVASVVTGKKEADIVHPAPALNLAQGKVRVDRVRFEGITEEERSQILKESEYPADGLYDREIVERLLNHIYGTNAFNSVSYYMEGREEPYTLVFDCQKGQVNDFALGLRADTDETVAIALHLGVGTRRLAGPRLATDLKLGTNPAFSADFSYRPKTRFPAFGVTARSRLINTSSGYMWEAEDRLLTAALDAYLEASRMTHGSFRAGLTGEMDPYERYLAADDVRIGWDWKSYWLSAFSTFKFDTFDDGCFPTQGVRVVLDGRYVFKGYSTVLDPSHYHSGDYATDDGSVPRYGTFLASFEGAFSLGSRFTVRPSLHAGWNSIGVGYINPKHVVTIGGFLPNRYTERQIPFFGFPTGYRNTRPISFVPRLDLQYRIGGKNYVTARGGLFWDDSCLKDLFRASPVHAYGAEYSHQTPVGPFRLAAQWCNITGFTVYASLGFDF